MAERSLLRRGVYILGGIAFLFAAGEEISWGQRIFGFATPDLLLVWNESQEFNAHNISNITFDRAYREGTLLLCMITGAAFFCRKDALFGIPLPSILLALAFLAVLVMLPYRGQAVNTPAFDLTGYIGYQEKGLLLLFAIYTVFAGQRRLFIITAAAIGFVLAFSYVNYNSAVRPTSLYEVREYLFGIICLCYAGELLLAQAPAGAFAQTPFTRMPFIGRQLTATFAWQWSGLSRIVGLAVCCLMIAGIVGLMAVLQYSNARTESANARAAAADFEERYRLIRTGAAGEPVVRSILFDVYLIGNELTYHKEPCDRADTEDRFFLHLIPDNVADLPGARRQYGFDNLDFDWKGVMREGRCITARLLPDYPITAIRTGQFVPDAGQVWQAEFPFPQR